MAKWDSIATVIVVAAPLVGAPLTAITFYVRTLRDHVAGKVAELTQRIEHLEVLAQTITQRLGEVDRDFVNKEEWVRESMLARGERQRLTEAAVRLEAEVHAARQDAVPAGRMDRAAQALLDACGRFEAAVDRMSAVAPRGPEG